MKAGWGNPGKARKADPCLCEACCRAIPERAKIKDASLRALRRDNGLRRRSPSRKKAEAQYGEHESSDDPGPAGPGH